MYEAQEITPFLNGFIKNATSFSLKQLVQAMLLRRHVSILRSQTTTNIDKDFQRKLNKSSHNTHIRNTRGFIKNVNFALVHIPEANSQLTENFDMFAIKRIISNFAAQMLVKKYMKLKKLILVRSLTRAIMNFLLKLLIIKTPLIWTKSRMKTLIGQ